MTLHGLFGPAPAPKNLATTLSWLHFRGLLPLVVSYTYGLVPLGFGMWLAHYSFHFLTGLYTIISVMQSALATLGWPLLGEPRWTLTGLPPNIHDEGVAAFQIDPAVTI